MSQLWDIYSKNSGMQPDLMQILPLQFLLCVFKPFQSNSLSMYRRRRYGKTQRVSLLKNGRNIILLKFMHAPLIFNSYAYLLSVLVACNGSRFRSWRSYRRFNFTYLCEVFNLFVSLPCDICRISMCVSNTSRILQVEDK